jgi:hypothetical protein
MSIDFGNSDLLVAILRFMAVIFVAYAVVLWAGAILWVHNDARQRSRDPALAVLGTSLAAFFFIPGVLLYLAARPRETLAEAQERQLTLELTAQHMVTTPRCSGCGRAVQEEFVRCPYCATTIRERCESCDRLLLSGWILCPYCGERVRAVQPEVPSFAARNRAPGRRPAKTTGTIGILHGDGHASAPSVQKV